MEKYICLIVSVIVMAVSAANLRWSLRGVFTEIKGFPFKYQVALVASVGAVFSIVIGVLTFTDGEKYQIVCRGILLADLVAQIVLNVILTVIHKRAGIQQLINRIKELGFDAFSDPIVVRRELMQNSNRAYSVSDVTKALNIMKKNI